jgi:hypothetical protein
MLVIRAASVFIEGRTMAPILDLSLFVFVLLLLLLFMI